MDIFLMLFLTGFVQYFRENAFAQMAGPVLLGLVFFLVGKCFPQRRYHRDRLNFIKRFISVCFDNPSLD